MVKTIRRTEPKPQAPPVKEGGLALGKDTGVIYLITDAAVGGYTTAVALESSELVSVGDVVRISDGKGFEMLPIGYQLLLEQN